MSTKDDIEEDALDGEREDRENRQRARDFYDIGQEVL